LPYSQALRIKCICTTQKDLQKELLNLKGYFLNRGYKEETVDKGFREALLGKIPRERNKDGTTLVVSYHPTNPPF
jgi:hypothetical protein